MTIMLPRRIFRRNKQPNPTLHGDALAKALRADLDRQSANDKSGATSPKALALHLINNPADKKLLLERLGGGDCTDPRCSAVFHATLCHVAYS